MPQTKYPLYFKATMLLLFFTLSIYGIIVAKHVLATLCLSILFAYLAYPSTSFLEKKKFPRVLAILISILLIIAVLSGILFFLYKRVEILLEDIPTLKEKALSNIDQLEAFIEDTFGISTAKQDKWIKDNINSLFESGSDFFTTTFTATTTTIAKLFFIPVFVFYFLYYRERINRFILMVSPDDKRKTINGILSEISSLVQRYVGGVFVVVLILSVINSAGLYIVGLKYALVFGVISAFFNFIPYLGTWIGAFFPITFALLTGDSPNLVVGVVILFFIIQFTENNILTPNITGSYVRLNPLVTIISLILAGMVWGIPGMLVIIPLMAVLKIIFERFESTKPYAYLIGLQESNGTTRGLNRLKSFFKKMTKK